MNGCCERCGAHLLGRPHPLVLVVDGGVRWRVTVCVRCRDQLTPRLLEAAREIERPHSLRVALFEGSSPPDAVA